MEGEPARTGMNPPSETGHLRLPLAAPDEPESTESHQTCHTVTRRAGTEPLTDEKSDGVALGLVKVKAAWDRGHDQRELRRALLDLLRELDG